jgi:hypothetical protein
MLKYLLATLRPPGISLAVAINIFLKPKAHESESQPVSLSAPNQLFSISSLARRWNAVPVADPGYSRWNHYPMRSQTEM